MKHLRQLEDQSVYILREAYKHFDHLAMLWSMGKDSTVLLWLTRKAFFGHVPFPLLHVDTSYKIPAMIEYRDRLAREWRLNLVIGQNKDALAAGMNHTFGRVACCTALKTNGLKNLLAEKGYTGVILGVRADEEGTRAKERYILSTRQTWGLGFQGSAAGTLGSVQDHLSRTKPIFVFIPC